MLQIIADSDFSAIVNSDFYIRDNCMMKYPEFANRFKALWKASEAPQTQKELGAWLGYSQPTINDWINGNKLPSMDTAIVISKKFDCCVEWLLTGRGPRKPASELTIYDLIDQSGVMTTNQKANFKALIHSFEQQDDQQSSDTGY